MTPEQSKRSAGEIQQVKMEWLSHFAQLIRKSKERYEGSYTVPFSESWFELPSNDYNPGLAYAAMGVCLSGYKNLPSNDYKYIRGSLEALGCNDIDITSYYHLNDENYIAAEDNNNVISYAVAHRDITRNGKIVPLVIVMVRGTSVSVEWHSNADVANSVADGNYRIINHEGFLLSAQGAYHGVTQYLLDHSIDTESGVLWIIAHSRGAAIANVLAAMFDEHGCGFTKDRIYSYNFSASPTTRRADANSEKFDNIFNVMNPEDYIPRIPPTEWDFKRFGTDYYFPSICTAYSEYSQWHDEFIKEFKEMTRADFPAFHGNGHTNDFERTVYNISNDAADMYQHMRYSKGGTISFAQYFRIFCDIAARRGWMLASDAKDLAIYGDSVFDHFLNYFLHNEILGHNAAGAHQEEGYLIKLKLCYEMGFDITKLGQADTRRFTVYGPVRLMVRNGAGKVVADIDNGKIDEQLYSEEDFISMYYDDICDGSSVWIPDEGEYDIEIVASKSGDYDCHWTKLDPMGAILEQTAFLDVPLKKGKPARWSELEPSLQAKQTKGAPITVDVEVAAALGTAKDGDAINRWDATGFHIMPNAGPNVVADAIGWRNAAFGQHVFVRAFQGKGYKFAGWYLKGTEPGSDAGVKSKPISKDRTFVLRAEDDLSLVAWFERK